MVYGLLRELLSDNGSNLIGKVLQSYIEIMKTKHRVTTPYHPRTNGKVEKFNGSLGATLTKLLTNKPIVLWDEYISQALFASRIRIHATSRISPYTLLFGKHPRLAGDENPIRPIAVSEEELRTVTDRIERMQHARMIANQKLVEKAIRAKKIRNDRVQLPTLKKGEWVLMRAESRNKFEGRWFGPYKIVEVMALGTYRLVDPRGEPYKYLVNGARLISAKVQGDVSEFWNSSLIQGMQRNNTTINESSPEVTALFEKEDSDTMTYEEMASIPNKEWKRMETAMVRAVQVGEEVQLPVVSSREETTTSQQPVTHPPQVCQPKHHEPIRVEEGIKIPLPPEITSKQQDEDLFDNDHQQVLSDDEEMGEDACTSVDHRDTTATYAPIQQDIMDVDDIDPTPQHKPKRISAWQRDIDVSQRRHPRTETPYSLRKR